MKRTCTVLLCLLLTAALLAGCGQKPDDLAQSESAAVHGAPAEVLAAMQTALETTPCTGMDMEMEMTVTLDGMTVTTATDMQITAGTQPGTGYIKTDIHVIGDGVSEVTSSESYVVQEEDTLVSYSNTGGVWTRLETGSTNLADTALLAQPDAASTTVDQAVTTWQGKPALCLQTALTGSALQDMVETLLDSLLAQLPEGAAPDFSPIGCAMTLYLDPVTYLPMAEQLTVTGMSQVLTPLYKDMGVSVSVDDYTATVTNRSYGAAVDVQLPTGAAENAARWERLATGEPDNGDGTFTIYDTNADGTTRCVMDVTLPTDGVYEVQNKGYDGVIVRREDGRELTYIVYYQGNDSGEGLVFQAGVESDVSRWQQNGGTVERERMLLETVNFDFTCELVTTQWSGLQDANLYAWALLGRDEATEGSYYLYITVKDGVDDGLGHVKNADITADEFIAYLEAAVPSALMS